MEANDESYVVSQLQYKKYSCPLALRAHIKEMVAASNVRDCTMTVYPMLSNFFICVSTPRVSPAMI